ncbi:hypothetical protein DAMA08_005000 [Martiniozyma asiatica (nom. inval.)]|nr:hypothetical protein DAMA08_005000 [Martiniozyma asiatica]
MEKYTDKYHPLFVPGTYSIYSSILIRHQHKVTFNKYKLLSQLEDDGASQGNSYQIGKQHDYLEADYNYKYQKNRKFKDIPDLKTKFGVILIPQPTNSINDPLNWSKRRKSLHFIILLLLTAFNAAISNDASAPTDSINALTGISYSTLNDTAGVLFVAIGVSTWLYSPFDYLLGRKIVVVLGALFLFLGSMWYARMKNDGDSFGSQILIGFGSGSSDAHVQLCFSSIFFTHQLGAVTTIYNMAYALGTFLGPLIANYVSASLGFRWVGWSGTIAGASILLIVLFAFEENAFEYYRFKYRNDDLTLNLSLMKYGILSASETDDSVHLGYYDEKFGWWRRFSPFKLTPNPKFRTIKGFTKHYLKLLTLPVRCLWFPPVLFAGALCGLQNALLTFYLTTEDTLLYDPPFNYDNSRVALMNVPCIVGSIIGCLYAGSITDYFTLYLARKNDGVVESEFRLYFAFLSGTFGAVGLLMFGFGISRNLDWRVFYIGLGFIAYMFSSSMNLAMLYVMDTYRDLVLETLVGVAFINNMFGCIFTFACSPWLETSGIENTYITLAVISLIFMYSAGLFIVWGKKWRLMTRKTYVELVNIKQDN